MYENSIVEIRTLEFPTTFYGQVLEFTGNYLLISTQQIFPSLKCNMAVNLTICDTLQGKIFYHAIIDKTLGSKIRFSGLKLLQRSQQRKEVRTKTSIPLSVSKLLINENKELSLDKIINMEMLDLSASGASLGCSLNLPEKLGFEIMLKLNQSAILTQLKIVRKQQISSSKFIYGCKFLNIKEQEAEIIRQFIFKLQIQERKKQKLQKQAYGKLERTS